MFFMGKKNNSSFFVLELSKVAAFSWLRLISTEEEKGEGPATEAGVSTLFHRDERQLKHEPQFEP